MKRISVMLLVASMLLVGACKESPTTPDPYVPPPIPPVTQTAIVITSANSMITIGQTEQMIATATMSNGTTKVVTGTWATDNSNVGTITESGLLSGISAGNVTISCESGGMVGYKTMAVHPLWKKSGVGNTTFDMPTRVSRVRIIGSLTGENFANFVVFVGGEMLVNEILYSNDTYSKTHATIGGETRISFTKGVVEWSFTQILK